MCAQRLSKTYTRTRHSVSLLHAHLVFVVKYRRRVITPRVFAALRAAMARSAKALDATITAIEAEGDHLHVLLLYPPHLAISRLAQRLKGASSRAVRAHRWPEVLQKLWRPAFWSPSYFVVSCGGAPLEVVKAYVHTQADRPQQAKRWKKRSPSTPYPRRQPSPATARRSHPPSEDKPGHDKAAPGSPH